MIHDNGFDLLGRLQGQTLSWPGQRREWQRRSLRSGEGPTQILAPQPENKQITINNILGRKYVIYILMHSKSPFTLYNSDLFKVFLRLFKQPKHYQHTNINITLNITKGCSVSTVQSEMKYSNDKMWQLIPKFSHYKVRWSISIKTTEHKLEIYSLCLCYI